MEKWKLILKKIGFLHPIEKDWLWLNYLGIKSNKDLIKYVAPFPDKASMRITTTLEDELEFAHHGVTIYKCLQDAIGDRWNQFQKILDFGCGCGRVARLFKDHDVKLFGIDIDPSLITWMKNNLLYMDARTNSVDKPVPFKKNTFDFIFSVSVLTHVNEAYQDKLLKELCRVAKPNSLLALTTHSERAMERVCKEDKMYKLIGVADALFKQAKKDFKIGKYAFIPQQNSHLTSEKYQYGISFIPASYIRKHWSKWFEILKIVPGSIHDWQDIIVLKPKKKPSIFSIFFR